MENLTVGSLFAGIGGFDLGFERAGFDVKWQVEIDPFCRKVLAKHFPSATRYEDVRTVGRDNLAPVDVVCGGFPCQDISVAGKGAGLAGERSGLWREMHRIISELRPRYVVVENVAALLGRGMGRVLGDLSEIGYDAEWKIISASDLGAPHQRERVWIVAYPASVGQSESGKHVRLLSANPKSDSFSWNGRRVAEPRIQRVADGIPRQLDRLRACGNAVVPQIPEWIAKRILELW